MDRKFVEEFANPSSEYRGAPFWAWNGKLKPQELRRQIRIMKQMGLGGFFMHSRVGLNTEYLSDDWFECVDACIDEADKLDMKAWLYDEDRWPSGAAGGLVTKNPKFRRKYLRMRRFESLSDYAKVDNQLAAVAVKFDGDEIVSQRKFSARGATKLAKDETLLTFSVDTAGCSSWFNGQSYLDTISREAVGEFVRVTHEQYRKRCAKHFGKIVPGIFTDEPNCGTGFIGLGPDNGLHDSRPWSVTLPKIFKQRYGFDITDRLVDLLFNVQGGDSQRVRWCFYDCVTFMFADAFAGVIGQWCEKNGLLHTGHVLHEDSPAGQVMHDGSCMRFYEYMQAPGMDLLTQFSRQWDTAKQVSSAARQFGRKWRLTETYGCTGWDFPLAGHKALSDWQVALGINLRCQHLAWYTMAGQAKRDYPAGIFEHSPWWKYYPVVEDYYARVHAAMTRGVEVRDVLVIHPNESIFLHTHDNVHQNKRCKQIDAEIVALRDTLCAANIDFDYGDEDIIARHGKISGKGEKALLHVAKAPYRVVIVPPLDTIRSTTLKLLEKFVAAGGSVIFAGKPAALVDALASDKAAKVANKCVCTPASGVKLAAAAGKCGRRLAILDDQGEEVSGALYLLRQDASYNYLFVCNTGHIVTNKEKTPVFSGHKETNRDVAVLQRTNSCENVTIEILDGCAAGAFELDPASGEIYKIDSRFKGGSCKISTSLKALESRVFVIARTAKAAALMKKRKALKRAGEKKIRSINGGSARGEWDITLDEPNVLVLDRPASRIGKASKWSQPKEILQLDMDVRDKLGIPHRGGRMAQPWITEYSDNPKSVSVELEYKFQVKTMPSGQMSLAMERPEAFHDISINGQSVNPDSVNGWWVDRSLNTLPVDPAMLKQGENVLTLSLDYHEYFDGLEIVYLLGDFGVKVSGGMDCTLTVPPAKLKLGDWTRQGMAFYGGCVSYNRRISPKLAKGERLVVTCPDYSGTAVRILVDGREAGIIAWPSAEVDITDYLGADGSAMLAVQIISHRRNSHGPLHLIDKNPRWVGPGQFTPEPHEWTDKFVLVATGLNAPPKLEVRK